MDVSALLAGGNQLDPEQAAAQLAHQQKIEQQARDLHVAERHQILRWAAVLCSCERRHKAGQASWAGCIVHGEFVIMPDGRIL